MFSFKLSSDFVYKYINREVNWGYKDAGGNSLGEITFIRSYSRLLEDGSKERWYQVCERVINGMYSIQKNHCLANRLPWDDEQAKISAEEAFERMFEFKMASTRKRSLDDGFELCYGEEKFRRSTKLCLCLYWRYHKR